MAIVIRIKDKKSYNVFRFPIGVDPPSIASFVLKACKLSGKKPSEVVFEVKITA